MISTNREETFDIFDKYYQELQEEWRKVEVLQDYSVEDMDPSLQTWMEGNKEKSRQLLHEESENIIDENPEINKSRIHVVETPYTPYLEWEIEVYKIINIPKMSETVYLVNKEEIGELNLPDGDFMIFDSKRVVRNHYKDGRMVSGDIYDEKDDISNFLNIWDELIKVANRV